VELGYPSFDSIAAGHFY